MSQEIFRTIILPMRQQLFVQAMNLLHNGEDAEDAVQDILLKIWHMQDSLDKYNNPAAFASTVAKNYCLDKLRLKKQDEELNDSFVIYADSDEPDAQLERKNTNNILRKIIDGLPPLQRSIIQMKDVEDYEVDEIAAITGTTPEAVRMNLSRARKKVRETYLKWINQ